MSQERSGESFRLFISLKDARCCLFFVTIFSYKDRILLARSAGEEGEGEEGLGRQSDQTVRRK